MIMTGLILKLLTGVGILAFLTFGGCQLKQLLISKELLATAQKENRQLKKEIARQKKATDTAVSDALAKCAAGKKLDAMKDNYKLTAKNCQNILRQKAKAIANQAREIVK